MAKKLLIADDDKAFHRVIKRVFAGLDWQVETADDGVEALVAMQLSDGGWGWFSGWGEHSSPHTTATVVHGLQVAVGNDVKVAPEVIQRGVDWLKRYQAEQVRLLVLLLCHAGRGTPHLLLVMLPKPRGSAAGNQNATERQAKRDPPAPPGRTSRWCSRVPAPRGRAHGCWRGSALRSPLPQSP